MDTSGIITEHSQIKLYLYRAYLEGYLSILLNTNFFNKVRVHDVFAGLGIARNNEEGSALIAAKTIDEITRTNNPFKKDVTLFLNDEDPECCASLKECTSQYAFAHISKMSADSYIEAWLPERQSHNFFFIDPFGYKDISAKNFQKLFSHKNCADFLIFIPTYHIYRFLRHEENEAQLKPIADFLNRIEINDEAAKKAISVDAFSSLIITAFNKMAQTKFVYKQSIHNTVCNSTYCLFFISHHPRGAEKFLEAQRKMEEHIERKKSQMSFSFLNERGRPSLRSVLLENKSYDNCELYHLGLENGLLPKEMNRELKKLEKEEKKIIVTALPGKTRNRGGYYIGFDKQKTIAVCLKG